jgi:DNA-binding NarL/FixJ family response regulator
VRALTIRRIAAELVLTEGTAANYVKRVLQRLGFHSRAQVAAWAIEHGLHTLRLGL